MDFKVCIGDEGLVDLSRLISVTEGFDSLIPDCAGEEGLCKGMDSNFVWKGTLRPA